MSGAKKDHALITIEAGELRVLHAVLAALHACDEKPCRENWQKVVEAYREAMTFLDGTGGRKKKHAA